MFARIDTKKIDKAFFRTQAFKNLVRIASAVFAPRLSGGFADLIHRGQSSWPALNPQYLAWKKSHGKSPLKWVRTGKTLKALSQGRIEKEGTKKGVRFKITPGRLWAFLRVTTFKPNKGRKPKSDVQKKIFRNLNYGVDAKGKANLTDASGRRLSGRPSRSLFHWRRDEIPIVEQSAAKETQAIIKEGLG